MGIPLEEYMKRVEIREKVRESHHKKLMDTFSALFPGEQPPKVPFDRWGTIFEEREYKLRSVKDYLDILEIAMKAEMLAKEIYTYLGKITANVEYKRIFLEIAEDEGEHYAFVENEYKVHSKIKARKSLQELVEELEKDKNAHSAGA